MKVGGLTYEQVREDLGFPPICTGCNLASANEHWRGINAFGKLHWSRGEVRRTGLHAFVRAGLQHYMNMEYIYEASVKADQMILEKYGIRIPASASKWERRQVLALARWTRIKLRTDHPTIYAWATYGGSK